MRVDHRRIDCARGGVEVWSNKYRMGGTVPI